MNMMPPHAAEPIVPHDHASLPPVAHLLWSVNSPLSTVNGC